MIQISTKLKIFRGRIAELTISFLGQDLNNLSRTHRKLIRAITSEVVENLSCRFGCSWGSCRRWRRRCPHGSCRSCRLVTVMRRHCCCRCCCTRLWYNPMLCSSRLRASGQGSGSWCRSGRRSWSSAQLRGSTARTAGAKKLALRDRSGSNLFPARSGFGT